MCAYAHYTIIIIGVILSILPNIMWPNSDAQINHLIYIYIPCGFWLGNERFLNDYKNIITRNDISALIEVFSYILSEMTDTNTWNNGQ